MSIKNSIGITLLCIAFGLPALHASAKDEWHFVVKNKTASNISKLQVSQDKKEG